MTGFQKYISLLLTVLVVMIGYYLFTSSVKIENQKEQSQILNEDLVFPDEYHIRIAHAGGEGIRNRTTEIIGIGDGDERYLNEPSYKKNEWAPSFMNNGGYIIWLSCRDGYTRKDCRSDSDTGLRMNKDGSCGITIDKMKIFGRLECIKS